MLVSREASTFVKLLNGKVLEGSSYFLKLLKNFENEVCQTSMSVFRFSFLFLQINSHFLQGIFHAFCFKHKGMGQEFDKGAEFVPVPPKKK